MTAFWYEIKFNLLRQYRYKLSFFTTLVSNLILFAGMTAAKSNQPVNGSDAAYAITLSMITYLFWNFGSSLISSNMSNISGDLMSGIFESKLLSKLDIIWLLFARMLSGLVLCIGSQLIVFAVSGLLGIISLSFIIDYLVILCIYLPGLWGMFGFSLLFCGLILKFKTLGSVSTLFTLVLFCINALYSGESLLVKILIPYTLGIDISKLYVVSRSFSFRLNILYILINITWGFAGCIFFKFMLQRTKQNGYFNAY